MNRIQTKKNNGTVNSPCGSVPEVKKVKLSFSSSSKRSNFKPSSLSSASRSSFLQVNKNNPLFGAPQLSPNLAHTPEVPPAVTVKHKVMQHPAFKVKARTSLEKREICVKSLE